MEFGLFNVLIMLILFISTSEKPGKTDFFNFYKMAVKSQNGLVVDIIIPKKIYCNESVIFNLNVVNFTKNTITFSQLHYLDIRLVDDKYLETYHNLFSKDDEYTPDNADLILKSPTVIIENNNSSVWTADGRASAWLTMVREYKIKSGCSWNFQNQVTFNIPGTYRMYASLTQPFPYMMEELHCDNMTNDFFLSPPFIVSQKRGGKNRRNCENAKLLQR